VVLDLNTRINAVRSGNLDILGLASDPATHDGLRKAAPDLKVLVTPNPNQGELGLRTDRGRTADLRVRKAIAKAINRQELSDTIFGGRTARHPGFVLPSPDWLLPEDEYKRLAAYDLDGARRLMQEAGLAGGFDLKLPVTNLSGGIYQTAAELLASQLGKINVRVAIQTTDNPAYVSGITNGTFDAFFGPTPTSNTSTNTELLTRHHSTGNRNGTGLRDPKLDAMIEQQAVMGRDPEGRKKILLDIQRYLLTDQPHLITLFVTVNEWFYQPFLREFYPGINGITNDQFTRTWIDK